MPPLTLEEFLQIPRLETERLRVKHNSSKRKQARTYGPSDSTIHGDPLDVQDDITARLARAMEVQLVAAETRRLGREKPKELDAVDLSLRGWTPILQRRNKFTASIEQQIAKIGRFREGARISREAF